MPIQALRVDALKIKNLMLTSDAGGNYAISLSCAQATAYVLCFGNGGLLTRKDLNLTEQELKLLYGGKTLEKEMPNGAVYRLQGVSSTAFHAMPDFRNFTVKPPEQIQVWSMLRQPNGTVTLFVPDQAGKEVCYVPLRYQVTVQAGNGMTWLTVRFVPSQIEKYVDGALLYRVNELSPIPIPKDSINTRIPLRLKPGEKVSVIADDAWAGKYVRA